MKKQLLLFLVCVLAFAIGLPMFSANGYHLTGYYRYECAQCDDTFDNRKELPADYDGKCLACNERVPAGTISLVGAPQKGSINYIVGAVGSVLGLAGGVFSLIVGIRLLLSFSDYLAERAVQRRYAKKAK